jgi:hypothetical protein
MVTQLLDASADNYINYKNFITSKQFLGEIYYNKLINSAVDEIQANKQDGEIRISK